MLTFKHFFSEAATPNYVATPPKARNQMGDVVVIRQRQTSGGQNFEQYHPKRMWPYKNQVGEIVGYKKGSQSVHYAVKFDDGQIHLILSQYIEGPFKDRAAAERNTDPYELVDPNDLANPAVVNARVEQYERDVKFENYLRGILTNPPFNFIWHKHINYNIQGSKMRCDIAGRKSAPSLTGFTWDLFALSRYNDKKTGKLANIRRNSVVNTNKTIKSPYILNIPGPIDYDAKNYNSVHTSMTYPYTVSAQDDIKKIAEFFDRNQKILQKGNSVTDDDILNYNYSIETIDGQVHVAPRYYMTSIYRKELNLVTIPEVVSDKGLFKNAVIDGNYLMYKDSEPDFRNAPKMVTGTFTDRHYANRPKKSLKGLQPGYGNYDILGHSPEEVQKYFDGLKAREELGQQIGDEDLLGIKNLFDNL